eukprot:scaffold1177_cov192-Alexandrium_tamarense.AAC.17
MCQSGDLLTVQTHEKSDATGRLKNHVPRNSFCYWRSQEETMGWLKSDEEVYADGGKCKCECDVKEISYDESF